MSRESADEIRDGAVYNGFDYDLQVWVRNGLVQGCGHPASMGKYCCSAALYAGQILRDINGREAR